MNTLIYYKLLLIIVFLNYSLSQWNYTKRNILLLIKKMAMIGQT
jgi:hypothetical protein